MDRFPEGVFDRADPSPDPDFYAAPRLVHHIDDRAVEAGYHRLAGGFDAPLAEQRLTATWRHDPLWAVWARRP